MHSFPKSARLAAITVASLIGHIANPAKAVAISGPQVVLSGDRPSIKVAGLAPHSEVDVESYRYAKVPVRSGATWAEQRVLFHASVQFWADSAGRLNLDTAVPLRGSYNGSDPRGLLWSGAVVGRAPEPAAPTDLPQLVEMSDEEVRVVVRVGDRLVADRTIRLVPWRNDVRFTTIMTDTLTGVFAAPARLRHGPTVILLHGSEGGTLAGAKALAARFASRGFAALAVIYFSWPNAQVSTVPQSFTGLPLERLAMARTWLARQPQADVTRLALVGGSKGAEFGLLGASVYPWVRAVVACAPSSVVWGAFGAPQATQTGSFLLANLAVPNIPYGDYGPVERGEITSAERHVRDRAAASPEVVATAGIAVERSRARLLLLSGGRDAVWPSDAMSAEIVARMTAYDKAGRVHWLSFPDAGHYLCGTGGTPIRWDENDEAALGGGLISADGRDPGRAWEATLAFLRQTLVSRRSARQSASTSMRERR